MRQAAALGLTAALAMLASAQAAEPSDAAAPSAAAKGPAVIPGIPPPETSVRERARTMVQADRAFLENLESVEERPAPAAPGGAAPPHPQAEAARPKEKEPERVRKKEAEPEHARAKEAPPERARARENPPERVRVKEASSAPARENEPPRPSVQEREPERVVVRKAEAVGPIGGREREPRPAEQPPISRAEVERFVQQYIQVSEGAAPREEVAMYADRVDYFGTGSVGREFIERDQRAYYRRWPTREFTLLEKPHVLNLTPSSATVRYHLRYRLNRGEEVASGQTEHILRLVQGEDGLRIAAIRERKSGD